jgi:hypothetical protein
MGRAALKSEPYPHIISIRYTVFDRVFLVLTLRPCAVSGSASKNTLAEIGYLSSAPRSALGLNIGQQYYDNITDSSRTRQNSRRRMGSFSILGCAGQVEGKSRFSTYTYLVELGLLFRVPLF